MDMTSFDDELLMAYADGELDARQAEAVERLMAADPQVAARVDMFRRTRLLAKTAVSDEAHAPVPAALRAGIERLLAEHGTAAPVPKPDPVPAAAFPENARRAANQPRFAIAASIALALVGAAAFWAGQRMPAEDTSAAVAGLGATRSVQETASLARALATVPSGQPTNLSDSARLEIVATVRSDKGALCRQFRIDRTQGEGVAAVACQDAGGWHVTIALGIPAADTGFRPAASGPALDSYLDSIGATAPLTDREERQALPSIGP